MSFRRIFNVTIFNFFHVIQNWSAPIMRLLLSRSNRNRRVDTRGIDFNENVENDKKVGPLFYDFVVFSQFSHYVRTWIIFFVPFCINEKTLLTQEKAIETKREKKKYKVIPLRIVFFLFPIFFFF